MVKVRLSGSELLFTHLNAVKAFAGSDVFFSLDEWFACVFIAGDGVAKLVGPPDCNNPDTVKLVNWIAAGRLLDCSSWDWRESTSEINSVINSAFNFEAPNQTLRPGFQNLLFWFFTQSLLWMYFYQPDWVGLRAKTGVAVKCSVGILILEQHFEQTVCLHIWHFCPREREKRPKRVDIHTKHIRPRSTSCDLRKQLKLTSHPINQNFIKKTYI